VRRFRLGEQSQLKGRRARKDRLQLRFRKDATIGLGLAVHALQSPIALQDVRRDVFQVERVSEDGLRRFDRLVDLRDRAAAVPQRVEMGLHVRALDVANVTRPEWRQLFVGLGQEADLQLRLILLQRAHAAIVGAAVIQEQIGHFLEGLALEGSGVFALPLRIFKLALQRLGIVPRATNGVPVILLRLLVVDDHTPSAALAGRVFFSWDAFDHGGSPMK
jgi:hypothetical protein